MNSRELLKVGVDLAEMVVNGYLADLTDEQLLIRPHAGCNHINWQLGHLISSEAYHLNKVKEGSAPPLPAGFAEKYSKETAGSDDPAAFLKKDELLRLHQEQLAAFFSLIAELSDADLDRETGVPYAPTVGALLSLQGSHWLMHAGQWVIVRRSLGKPALF